MSRKLNYAESLGHAHSITSTALHTYHRSTLPIPKKEEEDQVDTKPHKGREEAKDGTIEITNIKEARLPIAQKEEEDRVDTRPHKVREEAKDDTIEIADSSW